jgi:hypothetical protein
MWTRHDQDYRHNDKTPRKERHKMIVAQLAPVTDGVIYMVGSVATGTAFLTIWITNQFSKNRRDFYRVISRHNKEDDDRFAVLQDEHWELRGYIAKRDRTPMPKRTTLPRRRYLIETDNEQSESSEALNSGDD